MLALTVLSCGSYVIVSNQPDYWLEVVARAGVSQAVAPLVALGANPSPTLVEDQPLWQAARRGNRSTVQALLDAGADIHASEDFALALAAKYGHVGTVRLLLVRGANFHARDDWALRIAASEGQLETVKELLNAGADVHASNDEALRWARESGHGDVVDLLQSRRKLPAIPGRPTATQKDG
jgi:ankyrin repeat protein